MATNARLSVACLFEQPFCAAEFKALADEHRKVSLVIAGSKRDVMQQLVLDAAAPLYRMTTPFALEPIPADEMADFLVRRANAGGKDLTVELADRIVALAARCPTTSSTPSTRG